MQNQIQRRNDLIPNLVETVKGFAAHEEAVFKEIADSRSKLLAAKSPEETIAAANQQTSALGRLLAVVENYPNLKANEQFNRLMDELAGTENRLADRRACATTSGSRNTTRHAGASRRTSRRRCSASRNIPYFEAPPDAQAAPKGRLQEVETPDARPVVPGQGVIS